MHFCKALVFSPFFGILAQPWLDHGWAPRDSGYICDVPILYCSGGHGL